MSERGSYCTEYINCKKCFETVRQGMLEVDGFGPPAEVFSDRVPQTVQIIAGKAFGLYAGEELSNARYLLDWCRGRLCHAVTLAVIPDSADPQFFELAP